MRKPAILIFALLFISGCGFDLNSGENTIELPNTYGINVEVEFTTPQFILDHQVTFDEIKIHYTVRKNDAYVAQVKLYVSEEQYADAIQMPGDEDVINVMLGVNENEKSGTVTSPLLVQILNNKQPRFVIGAQNLSVNPVSSIFIDVDITYKGSYKL